MARIRRWRVRMAFAGIPATWMVAGCYTAHCAEERVLRPVAHVVNDAQFDLIRFGAYSQIDPYIQAIMRLSASAREIVWTALILAAAGGVVAWLFSRSTSAIYCKSQAFLIDTPTAASLTFYVDLDGKSVKGPDKSYPIRVTERQIDWAYSAQLDDRAYAEEVTITKPDGALTYVSKTTPNGGVTSVIRATGSCTGPGVREMGT